MKSNLHFTRVQLLISIVAVTASLLSFQNCASSGFKSKTTVVEETDASLQVPDDFARYQPSKSR